jgi:hypothetical protein
VRQSCCTEREPLDIPAELFSRSVLTSCEFIWNITAELLSAWIVAIMCPG